MAAARRLWAAAAAGKSPLNRRLISSIGWISALPPPVPPPFTPNTGPIDGSRTHNTTFLLRFPRPIVSEMLVVVLPSPALVGVTAVTMTILPSGRVLSRSRIERRILARESPKSSSSSGCIPALAATCAIGSIRNVPSAPALEEPRVEWKREQLGQAVHSRLAAKVGQHDFEVATELPENLPAGTARRCRRLGIRDHLDAAEPAMPLGERLEHGDALGAQRQPVRCVFDVAACDDSPVLRLECSANFETRKPCMRMPTGPPRSV